jgi:hypothetical protein
MISFIFWLGGLIEKPTLVPKPGPKSGLEPAVPAAGGPPLEPVPEG